MSDLPNTAAQGNDSAILRPGQHRDDGKPTGKRCWCGEPLRGRQTVACSDEHRAAANAGRVVVAHHETPSTVHGRLMEAVHITGYTMERACAELDWLLDDDRWKQCGQGFDDVNEFLTTVDMGEFRLAMEQRKKLVKKLAAIEASQRATARALGVGQATVSRDLQADSDESSDGAGTAQSDDADQPAPSRDPDESSLPPYDPTPDGGKKAAKHAEKRAKRKQRDEEAERRRVEEAQRQAESVETELHVDIRHGDFREVLADLSDVDAIITDPPYGREYLPLLDDLAAWADEVLTEDGVLAILMGQSYLPEVYRRLDGHRAYRWTACYETAGPAYVSRTARLQSQWKPLLIYGGGPRFSDLIRSDGSDAAVEKTHHRWGQDYGAFRAIVERLTGPGQTVADPFMGSGTTLLAAWSLGRHVIGCDIDETAVRTAQERIR